MTPDSQTPQNDPPLFDRPPGYRSYVLRFWQERSEQSSLAVWRFSLQDPSTDQRFGFANLQALVAWLKAEMRRAGGLDDPG